MPADDYGIVNWCRVAISNDKSTQWVPSLFCVSFLISFFLKLTLAGRLWVICVREDNDSNDYTAYMDYMDPIP